MTVFAVQSPQHRDPASGAFVPKFNLSPAKTFGEIVELLGPNAKPFRPEPLIEEMYSKLAGYQHDTDYIICIGNPILLALAVSIAASMDKGRVNLLQWHGRQQRYVAVPCDLGWVDL